ncbi:TIGR04086 family membrane protein [Anaerotignum neopropionicum]|nr:TIGR04086 family membrane protein [Anaerotignum neopropionicum]
MKTKKRETKKKIQKKRESMEKQSGQGLISMVKGMAIAYAITCIFFIAYGLILTYTNVSEQSLPMIALACTAISTAIAGYDWAKCRKKNGLLMGLLAGFIYTVILFIVTALASDTFTVGMSKVMTLIVALAGGGIGGILGVNGKK